MQSPWRKTFRATLVSLVVVALLPAALLAQADCGTNCRDCATGKKEGYSYNSNGDYNMLCVSGTTGCQEAGCGAATLVSDAPREGDLLAVVRSTPVDSLSALAGTLRERLLVFPERNMVALRGAHCAANSIVAVLFLPRARVAALAKSGLPHLKTFLALNGESLD